MGNMKISFLLILCCISIISCIKEDFDMSDLVGEYSNVENAENYSGLLLREDSTFHFAQSHKFSDIMGHTYGKWRIDKNKLKLTQSINLSDSLTAVLKENIDTDSLLIIIDENLKNQIGNFKLKINFDSTIWSNPNIIKINRSKYYEENKHRSGYRNKDKPTFYKTHMTEIEIWNQNYYIRRSYMLSNSQINISLKSPLPNTNTLDLIRVQYTLSNNNLVSKGNNSVILPHILEKRQ